MVQLLSQVRGICCLNNYTYPHFSLHATVIAYLASTLWSCHLATTTPSSHNIQQSSQHTTITTHTICCHNTGAVAATGHGQFLPQHKGCYCHKSRALLSQDKGICCHKTGQGQLLSQHMGSAVTSQGYCYHKTRAFAITSHGQLMPQVRGGCSHKTWSIAVTSQRLLLSQAMGS